jgi:hypothetical protein
VSEDDRAVMARLAALEAEVKGDADAQRARKEAAMAKIREQRAAQLAEREALRPKPKDAKPKELVATKKASRSDDDDEGGELDGLSSALDLAKRAQNVKQELSKPGEKSWAKSAVASALLGPIGWLYAGSFREAIPASAAWLAFAALASKLPAFLLMPVFFVALPLSAIAGIMYAVRYNRTGSRQRLFQDKKALAEKAAKKQLKAGKDD